MDILYITNARIPTEKAHGYQICKMCEEFGGLGSMVELWVPARKNHIKQDIFSYYNLKKNFQIRYLKTFDFFRLEKLIGRYASYFQSLFFFVKLLFIKVGQGRIIYTRSPEIAWLFKTRGYKTVYEAHNWPGTKTEFYKFLLKKVDLIVCNSVGTEKKYQDNGFKNTLLAPNGVDLKDFAVNKDKAGLRKEYGLPADKKIVMYVGHLYKWKGADIILQAADLLKNNKSIEFVLVGGTANDINKYKERLKGKELNNVNLFGYRNKREIPGLMKAADILLLPNVPVTEESVNYTSPIKMFEYMAAGRPIIASDLPSIREALNKNNALLVPAGDAQKLVGAIEDLIVNKTLADKISAQAEMDAEKYTWGMRAENVLSKIKDNCTIKKEGR